MTAPKVGAPGAGVEAGTEAQGTADTAQFTGQPADLQAAGRAQFEQVRGTLALRGIDLLANAHGGYIVRRGKLTQTLNGLDAAERFALLIGGAA